MTIHEVPFGERPAAACMVVAGLFVSCVVGGLWQCMKQDSPYPPKGAGAHSLPTTGESGRAVGESSGILADATRSVAGGC